MSSHFTVVYDACVLYPAPLRDLLMRLALTDRFRARWLRIPAQAGRRFQPKLDSNSKASWTLIPAQAGQAEVIT
jgi:hypothetical protein